MEKGQVAQYIGYEMIYNWHIKRGTMIHMDKKIMVNPFDYIEIAGAISDNVPDILQTLDALKKVMNQYIDMRCPILA